MNYEIIENITSADIAIRVKADSPSLLFKYGAEALMAELIEDLSSIKEIITKEGSFHDKVLSLLYFEFLNEILFFKDSENILLKPANLRVSAEDNLYVCEYTLKGAKINKLRHKSKVDIKAVTLHELKIYEDNNFYIAETVFDV